MGLFSPISSSTVYSRDYHWARSPEVWGSVIKIAVAAFVLGFILGAVIATKAVTEESLPTPKVSYSPGATPTVEINHRTAP